MTNFNSTDTKHEPTSQTTRISTQTQAKSVAEKATHQPISQAFDVQLIDAHNLKASCATTRAQTLITAPLGRWPALHGADKYEEKSEIMTVDCLFLNVNCIFKHK